MARFKLQENLSFVFWRRDEGEVEHAVHEDGHEDEDGQGQEGRHQLQGKDLGHLERLLYLLRGFS